MKIIKTYFWKISVKFCPNINYGINKNGDLPYNNNANVNSDLNNNSNNYNAKSRRIALDPCHKFQLKIT